MSVTVGVDVGGTKVLAALVDADGNILSKEQRPTANHDYGALLDTIQKCVEVARGDQETNSVGLAIAGHVVADGSRALFGAHLPLAGEPIRDDLTARLGLPVTVDNDGNAAGWAEHRFGAGRGYDDVLMVTVGTGLGAGLVFDGRLYRGGFGFAGEPGHMAVVRDGRPCPCGSRGCWERYASGTALLATYHELGGDPELDGPQVTTAAIQGDPLAREAFTEIGDWLGYGLAGVVTTLDPAIVVIGGGVSEAGNLLMVQARKTFSETITGKGLRPEPPIVLASLGQDAGVIGAATIARERHESSQS
jgi:glucokinase